MAEHAGRRLSPEPGTILLFAPNEDPGFWNQGGAPTQLLVLSFRIASVASAEFRPLLGLAPHERIVKLSMASSGLSAIFSTRSRFKRSISSSPSVGNGTAASAWLALALTSVMRRIFTYRQGTHLPEVAEEVDRACYELWQSVHRHAHQTKAAEPMLLSQDPAHDSLRHRFRRIFGVSPHSLLVRLRMERGKELLRASNLSVKEIAQELGYSRQHEFARAFRSHFGVSPSEWRGRGKEIPIAALATIRTANANGVVRTIKSVLPKLRRAFPKPLKTTRCSKS